MPDQLTPEAKAALVAARRTSAGGTGDHSAGGTGGELVFLGARPPLSDYTDAELLAELARRLGCR